MPTTPPTVAGQPSVSPWPTTVSVAGAPWGIAVIGLNTTGSAPQRQMRENVLPCLMVMSIRSPRR
jgi:hypothetical protein